MAWIKRNIGFVVGSLVAIALMVAGGVYLLSKLGKANDITEQIRQQYAELDRINKLNPHPGSGKTDNIKLAKEQDQKLRAYVEKTKQFFQKVPAIPDSAKVSNAEFAAQLRNTVAQLHREAELSSVELPRDYYFTFEAQRRLMLFDSGAPDKLAVHLGEIKAITEVLFKAKVNSLDSIRRELVSTNNDTNPSDYFPTKKTESTPLADLTPYEFTFRCFSPELALVLSSLSSSPNGFVVKSVNVEPSIQADILPGSAAAIPAPVYQQPTYVPPPQAYNAAAETARRYGPSAYAPAPAYQVPYTPPAAAARPGGSTTFLNEKPVKVTLMVYVVKLKPPTK